MKTNSYEKNKETKEREILSWFLANKTNPYSDYKTEKCTRPDFVLHGNNGEIVGVEIIRLTTQRDENLSAISHETFGKGLTGTEIKAHARKYHKTFADSFEYYDFNSVAGIGSGICSINKIKNHFADELLKKYNKYQKEIKCFDSFIILADASSGPGILITDLYDINNIVERVKEKCPAISGVSIAIVWDNCSEGIYEREVTMFSL